MAEERGERPYRKREPERYTGRPGPSKGVDPRELTSKDRGSSDWPPVAGDKKRPDRPSPLPKREASDWPPRKEERYEKPTRSAPSPRPVPSKGAAKEVEWPSIPKERQMPQAPKKTSPIPKREPEKKEGEVREKREFLQREEVHTMEKDLANIRGRQAGERLEHIEQLNSEGQPSSPNTGSMKKDVREDDVYQKNRMEIPGLPSGSQKILTRILIAIVVISLIVNVGAGIYFLFMAPEEEDPAIQPSVPTGLSLELRESRFLMANWNETEGSTRYELRYSQDSNFSEYSSFENIEGTVQAIERLDEGSHYYVQVRSCIEDECSSWSSAQGAAIPEEETSLETTQRFVTWGHETPENPRDITSIILHSAFSSGSDGPYDTEAIVAAFEQADVTYHYIIERNGTIWHLTPDENIAYHATGQSPFTGNELNHESIGIGMVYQRDESPNQEQYTSLARLIQNLQKQYEISDGSIHEYSSVHDDRVTPWNFDNDRLFEIMEDIQ